MSKNSTLPSLYLKITWIRKFNDLLSPRRLSYAWIAGGALWLAWFLSIITGSNGFDKAGQIIGTDYIQFYTAGRTLLKGDSAYLYDFSYQSSLEREIAGPGLTSFHAFITPPLFALLFLPLSLLPYQLSYVIWSVFGLLLLGFSIVLLSNQNQIKIFSWSLIWFPVFACISFGQNSLLSLAILSLVYLCWKKEKYFLSGLITSLLFYKPQLALGVLFLFLLDHKRKSKAIAGFILSTLVIIILNFQLFPEASSSYWSFVRNELPSLISREQFPIWHMHTVRGFWMMLLGDSKLIADILYGLTVVMITFGFVNYYQRNQKNKILIFAVAICFTILISPHAMIYDWSLLLIPSILLWYETNISKILLKPLFAILWIGVFLSGPLTYIQLTLIPIAIQISIPIVFISLLYLYNHNIYQPG